MTLPNRPINVFSACDGISCGRVALARRGIPVATYIASEIDKFAIKVSEHNYPEIIRMGDLTKWREWDVDWGSIDLLLGGTPCQGFSRAGKQLAFDDPRSKLFFVFVDILNHIRSLNPNVKFLLENVRMKKEHLDTISEYLGVEGVMINSALVSAQERKRYYWFNWDVAQPQDRNILLRDVLHDYNGEGIAQRPRGKNAGGFHRHKSPTMSASSWQDNNIVCSDGWHKWWDEHKEFQTKKLYSQVCNDKDKSITLIARMYANWSGNFVCNVHPSGKGINGEVHSATGDKSPTLTTNKGEGPKIGLIRVDTAEDIKGHDTIRRVYSRDGKCPTLTANSGGNQEPKVEVGTLVYRKLTPVECERLQTLPELYTDVVSNAQRYRALGNGWTVDVIVHILSGVIATSTKYQTSVAKECTL